MDWKALRSNVAWGRAFCLGVAAMFNERVCNRAMEPMGAYRYSPDYHGDYPYRGANCRASPPIR